MPTECITGGLPVLFGFEGRDVWNEVGVTGSAAVFKAPSEKGIVTPAQFRQFCSETVPLARLPKRTYTGNETFTADIDVAHYGVRNLDEAAFGWRLTTVTGTGCAAGVFAPLSVPCGELTRLGTITTDFSSFTTPTKVRLEVFLSETEITNAWDQLMLMADW